MKRPIEPTRPRKPTEPSKPQEFLAPMVKSAYVYDGTSLKQLLGELGDGDLDNATFDISSGSYDGDSAEVILRWNVKERRENKRYPMEMKQYLKKMQKYEVAMKQYRKDMEIYESSMREYRSLEKQYLRWFHENELRKLA